MKPHDPAASSISSCKRRQAARRLTCQTLEQRRLLAYGAYQVELLEDVNGNAGSELIGPIEAGETFFVAIDFIERDPFAQGLIAAAVDVRWDSGLMEVIEEDFDLDDILTEALPTGRGGRLDNDAGLVKSLRADNVFRLNGRYGIGDQERENFAMIRMRATAAGEAMVWVQENQLVNVAAPAATWVGSDLRWGWTETTIMPSDPTDFELQVLPQSEPQPEPALQVTLAQPSVRFAEIEPSWDELTHSIQVAPEPIEAESMHVCIAVGPQQVVESANSRPLASPTASSLKEDINVPIVPPAASATIVPETFVGPLMPSWMRRDAFELLQSLGLRWDAASGRWVTASQGANS